MQYRGNLAAICYIQKGVKMQLTSNAAYIQKQSAIVFHYCWSTAFILSKARAISATNNLITYFTLSP